MPRFSFFVEGTHRRKLKKTLDKKSNMAMNEWRKEKYADIICLHLNRNDERDVYVSNELKALAERTRSFYAKSQFLRRVAYLVLKNGQVSLEDLSKDIRSK